jgi:hypothetical protein
MGRFDALLTIDTKKEAAGEGPEQRRATPPAPDPQAKRPTGQPKQELPERPNARTPVRANGKRIITRNSFEIYEDQMDALRRRSMDEKLDGRLGSMSAMVREAIDRFIKDEPAKKTS